MATRYINMRGPYGVETVDEFPYNNKAERKEAHFCLGEYRFGDPYNSYYMSQKCTNEWREK